MIIKHQEMIVVSALPVPLPCSVSAAFRIYWVGKQRAW